MFEICGLLQGWDHFLQDVNVKSNVMISEEATFELVRRLQRDFKREY
jgi:predicted nucleic-acid-binding protein